MTDVFQAENAKRKETLRYLELKMEERYGTTRKVSLNCLRVKKQQAR